MVKHNDKPWLNIMIKLWLNIMAKLRLNLMAKDND